MSGDVVDCSTVDCGVVVDWLVDSSFLFSSLLARKPSSILSTILLVVLGWLCVVDGCVTVIGEVVVV